MQEAVARAVQCLKRPNVPAECPDLIKTASQMYTRTSCRLLVIVLVHAAGCHPHFYSAASDPSLMVKQMPDGSDAYNALLDHMRVCAAVQAPLAHRNLISQSFCSLTVAPSVLRDNITGFNRYASTLQKQTIDLEENGKSNYTFLVVVAPKDGGNSLTFASKPLLDRLVRDPAFKVVRDSISEVSLLPPPMPTAPKAASSESQ
jgi:hypothetical protein